MTEVMAWSYSRLNDFEKCPKMFQGKYVTKEFPQADFSAPHLQRGKDVHKELEIAVKTGNYDLLREESKFMIPLLEAARRGIGNRKHKGFESEQQKAFDAQLKEVSWFDPKKGPKRVWCRIIMDLMVFCSGDVLVILDWKTGKIRDVVDQLGLFSAGGFALYPDVKKVIAAFVWCDHPKALPLVVEYERKDAEKLWREFGDRAELIQLSLESGVWEPKPMPFNCKYCPALPSQCEHKARYS